MTHKIHAYASFFSRQRMIRKRIKIKHIPFHKSVECFCAVFNACDFATESLKRVWTVA
jgi:hypothetical protein